MDCFGTYFTHVQTSDETRVQSATEWTASVHASHVSEARLDKKCDENAGDTTAKRKTLQKMTPIFRTEKVRTCHASLQIAMF